MGANAAAENVTNWQRALLLNIVFIQAQFPDCRIDKYFEASLHCPPRSLVIFETNKYIV